MKRSTWIAAFIGLAAVAGLCLMCLVGAVVLLGPSGLSIDFISRDRVLLRLPGRRQSIDLVLLRLGQPLDQARSLVEDSNPGSALLFIEQDGDLRPLGNAHFGGFVPGAPYLLIQYLKDGETHIERVRLRTGEPTEVLETPAALTAIVLDNGSIFLHEASGSRQRCYLSRSGAQAERVGRGDQCLVSRDGSILLVANRSGRGLTLTASNLDGSDAIQLLVEEEGVESFLLSADGSRLAYVQAIEGGMQQLVALSCKDGGTLFASEAFFRIADYGFAPAGSALYFIGETEDVELALYAFDGDAEQVAQAPGLAAAFSLKGETLIYLLSDEEGSGAVFAHPMGGGDEVEVVGGENLGFALLTSPERILVLEQVEDEITLSSADIGGRDLVELFSDTGLARGEVLLVPGEPWLYLLLTDVRGDLSLYFTPLGRGDGRMLLEDFDSLRLLHRSPRASALLFAARQDPADDVGLYQLPTDGSSQPALLDDDFDEVLNAAFTRHGRQVIYTALTRPDEPEVRRLPADGSRPPETLYSDAALVDIQWDRLAPFADAAVAFQTGQTAAGLCPGARVIRLGESLEGSLSSGTSDCYRLHLDGALDLAVSVRAGAALDAVVAVYNRTGNLINEDDDSGPGMNPRLHLHLDSAGTYFVVVRGYDAEAAGPYTLAVSEDQSVDAQQNARPLLVNERLRGAITAADELYLQPYEAYLYGILYAFEAQADDWAEIEVRAGSIGSRLQPAVILFDGSLESIAYGEPEGEGDARLAHRIPEAGRYYVLVTSQDEEYGAEADTFFDITLSLGTAPEPGGGPIDFGQTVEGATRTADGDRWVFDGRAGDIVTIRMDSEHLDCYLELLNPVGLSIASDDDSGGNSNAFINGFRLSSTGRHIIIARGFNGRTGPYTLSLTRGEVTAGGGTIAPGQTVSGTIVLPGGDEWTFSGIAGQRVTISMFADFDTYLELRGPEGTVLTSDDDSGGNMQSRISNFTLPQTGTYTIIARSFGREAGLRYTLRLE